MRFPTAPTLAAVLFLALFSPLTAHSQSDGTATVAAMRAKLQDKLLYLRGFYTDSKIRYAANGIPSSKVHPGSWTTAKVLVKKIHQRGEEIVIEGERVGMYFDDSKRRFKNVLLPAAVRLELPNPKGAPSEHAVAASSKIFLNEETELEPEVAKRWTFWGPVRELSRGRDYTTPVKVETPHGVFRIGGNVVPPQSVYAPNPKYNSLAKDAGLKGISKLSVVVDADGSTRDIKISRPLGMGLDELAAEAVQTWRFKPASKNGTPVPVHVTVEVSFDLI